MNRFGPQDLKWDHWHIEVSSICPLKCPRCPRQESPESLKNTQLDLLFFKNQLGDNVIKNIKKITFCGNDGDPIYCKEFLEIVSYIKKVNPSIILVIITNGSYKDNTWWQSLGKLLNQHDEIHWSIDGVDAPMNSMYRINSDWNSIVSGIESFNSVNSTTFKVWATIAFSFNEANISDFLELARSLNFDLFQLTLSTKFEFKYPSQYKNDALAPKTVEFINKSDRYIRKEFPLTIKSRESKKMAVMFLQRRDDIERYNKKGLCQIGNKGVFLNSLGEFYPCCWVANRYEHNDAWHKLAKSKFNLKENSFEDVINDKFWSDEFLNFAHQECQTKCSSDKFNNNDYITLW